MRKRRGKNFLPVLILLSFFWLTQIFIVIFINPDDIKNVLIPNSYFLFFANLFFALFLTLSIILANSRRGLILSLAIIIFLILRLNQLANILNLTLMASLILVLEAYFTKKS